MNRLETRKRSLLRERSVRGRGGAIVSLHNTPFTDRQVVKLLLDRVMTSAYAPYVSVDYGEGERTVPTRDLDQLRAYLGKCDEEYLRLFVAGSGTLCTDCLGWIRLIWGEGVDVVNDYSDNVMTRDIVEPVMKEVHG